MRIRDFLSRANSTQIPKHETTKKKCNINKQRNKEAKTEEGERNYQIFAHPVFINAGRVVIITIITIITILRFSV